MTPPPIFMSYRVIRSKFYFRHHENGNAVKRSILSFLLTRWRWQHCLRKVPLLEVSGLGSFYGPGASDGKREALNPSIPGQEQWCPYDASPSPRAPSLGTSAEGDDSMPIGQRLETSHSKKVSTHLWPEVSRGTFSTPLDFALIIFNFAIHSSHLTGYSVRPSQSLHCQPHSRCRLLQHTSPVFLSLHNIIFVLRHILIGQSSP